MSSWTCKDISITIYRYYYYYCVSFDRKFEAVEASGSGQLLNKPSKVVVHAAWKLIYSFECHKRT